MKKVVVITGASSGIGLSHAIYLTHLGYTVFGTSRNSAVLDIPSLKETFIQNNTKWRFTNKGKTTIAPVKLLIPKAILQNLDELLNKITFINLDVTSDDSVSSAITEIESKATMINGYGIDILINNAGISFFKSIEDLSMEDWQKSFNTNFFGMIRVIKAVLPYMRERKKGQIINTSTLGAIAPIPFQSHYSTSKVAVKLLTEGLRTELKPFNIKVSTILPSDINTNFNINTLKVSKHKESTLTSMDIEQMITNPPIEDSSPYYQSAKKVWKIIVQNLIVSPPPLIISRKISKIIRARKPKINYKAGSCSQKFLTFLIRRITSDELTYLVLPKYFGL